MPAFRLNEVKTSLVIIKYQVKLQIVSLSLQIAVFNEIPVSSVRHIVNWYIAALDIR